jgi:Ca2+ transporting ATPase
LVTELRSSSRDGLTGEEGDLANRREVFGQNWIAPKDSKSFLRLLWEAFLDPLLIILTAVAAIGLGLWGYTYGSMSQEDRDQDEKEFLGWIESVSRVLDYRYHELCRWR